ncbi:hypothetical protein BHE74_00045199 [Ensete ventricosum]|nr:hypothetical protein GW17_00017083 [Ensete ventricosum]RWW48708.1 hypothetical protein BHE74_00045199 [Ensete ventricosum]
MVQGVRQKKTETRRKIVGGSQKLAGRLTRTGAMKLQPDDGPRSSLGIGPSSDDVVGSRRSSLGDSQKGSGSSLGTHREIAGRRPEDSRQECRRLTD